LNPELLFVAVLHLRASMIWILGEYCDRIDSVDDLLSSFLDNFQEENVQVQLQLLTAIVKLFLKRPADTQELVQNVLSLATQDSDNPDLRDRGYIYWRLLSTDPAAAKDVVLAEKPTISEETDLLEPALLDELICHISTLASVYHKPPSAFVEGKVPVRRITLQPRAEPSSAEPTEEAPPEVQQIQAVIPQSRGDDLLIGDLLSLDIPTGPSTTYNAPSGGLGDLDFLTGDLGGLQITPGQPVGGGGMLGQNPMGGGGFQQPPGASLGGLGLGLDFFPSAPAVQNLVLPKAEWLSAASGKGLQIMGAFVRRSGQITAEMSFTNKALQAMGNFAIQFNKNSFGLVPGSPLQVQSPLMPNQTVNVVLGIAPGGPVQKMNPLSQLQVAVKNNIDVLYFSTRVPMHVLFSEDGQMDRKVFLATWKEIPQSNEVQSTIDNVQLSPDQIQQKLEASNVFTIARRSVDMGGPSQELLYTSLKFINNIWVLAEFKLTPNDSSVSLALKTVAMDVVPGVQEAFSSIIHS